jgi:nucleoside 2-deoxyribosyltransferase
MSDYADEPEFQEWAKEVREGLIPKMADSSAVVSLVPSGDTDVKFAVELGFSIMLDKPIIAVVQPGSKVPAKLVKVADYIVEADLDSEQGRQRLNQRVIEILEAIGHERD